MWGLASFRGEEIFVGVEHLDAGGIGVRSLPLLLKFIEGDEAAQFDVLSLDHAHASAAKFLDNAVVRDGLADHVLIDQQIVYW
jgi:hypothetical protein